MGNSSDPRSEGIGPDGVLRHSVPTHLAMRVFLIAAGAFVMVLSVGHLNRSLGASGASDPLFTLPIIAVVLVGLAMILFGLFGPSVDWTIRPGRIEIVLTNPFQRRVRSFTPEQVADIAIRRFDDSDGPTAWRVMMKSVDGKRYQSRSYSSPDPALQLKAEIERLFYG